MKLSPLDIRKQTFTRRLRGLDAGEVEAFLEMLARQWEEQNEDGRHAEERVRELEMKVRHYEKVELALQEALEHARENSRRAADTAEHRARLIVEEAELRAQGIVQDANQERYAAKQDLSKINSRQGEIAARLRAFLMAEMEILAQFQGEEPHGFLKLLPGEGQAALPPASAATEPGLSTFASESEFPESRASAEPPVAPVAPAAAPVVTPEPLGFDFERIAAAAGLDAAPDLRAAASPEPTAAPLALPPEPTSRPEPASVPPLAMEPAPAPSYPPAPAPVAAHWPTAAPDPTPRSSPEPPAAPPADQPRMEQPGPVAPPPASEPPLDRTPWIARLRSAVTAPIAPSPLAEAPAPPPAAPVPLGPMPEEDDDRAPTLYDALLASREADRAPAPRPDAEALFAQPLYAAPYAEADGPASGPNAAPGWDYRALVTGEHPDAPNVAATESEREKIRRILEDLD